MKEKSTVRKIENLLLFINIVFWARGVSMAFFRYKVVEENLVNDLTAWVFGIQALNLPVVFFLMLLLLQFKMERTMGKSYYSFLELWSDFSNPGSACWSRDGLGITLIIIHAVGFFMVLCALVFVSINMIRYF